MADVDSEDTTAVSPVIESTSVGQDSNHGHTNAGVETNSGGHGSKHGHRQIYAEIKPTSGGKDSSHVQTNAGIEPNTGGQDTNHGHRQTHAGNPSSAANEVTCFEDLMEMVGTKGRWSLLIIIVCSLAEFVSPYSLISYQFLGGTPDYWCSVPDLLHSNWTQQQIITLAVPLNNNSGRHHNCLVHNYNYTTAAMLGFEAVMSDVSTVTLDGPDVISCTSRVYNTSYVRSSIVTEWDLTCERRVLYSTTQAVTQVGTLVGSIIYGHVLHRFGRRKGVLVSTILSILVGFLTITAPNIQTFIIFKFLFHTVDFGCSMGCYIFAMEVSGVSGRGGVGSLFLVPYAVGYMIVPGLAYLVNPWRSLQALYTGPIIIALLFFWFLPESPRWLILAGRYDSALKVMKRAAVINHKTPPPDHIILAAMDNIRDKEERSSDSKPKDHHSLRERLADGVRQIFLLVLTPEVRGRSLVVFYLWAASSAIYYGVSLNSYNLSTDIYMYTFLGGVMELLSYLLLWLGVTTLGRRKMLILLYLICGASISILAGFMLFMQEVPEGVKVCLSLSGKIAITAAFGLIWFYTIELFSTKYRARALGEASMFGRIGGISSPYINDIMGEVVVWGPSVLFSLTAILAAAVVFALPETSNKNLPQKHENTKLPQDTIGFSVAEMEK